MVEKLLPDINKVYFIEEYTLIHILSGSGSIQVDFNNYLDWQDKVIYLEKGQYIKFQSEDFIVRKIEFPNENIFRNKEVRVLFKHLISLGYIDFKECSDCQKYLTNSVFSQDVSDIVDISSEHWYWQNPFHASREEYQIIFDIKDVIDEQYANKLTVHDFSNLINENGYQTQALVKDKIGLSVKKLLGQKKLLESKKQIAFTDKNMQEISYDLGFNDSTYFNRVFKKVTGKSPVEFRVDFDFKNRDLFVQNIIELLKDFHTQERSLEFYADKMNLSVKTLSKKVRAKMNVSLGQLIRLEILNTAKVMLIQGESISTVAGQLRFEEPNHFTRFFKHYSGVPPSEFKNKKYNF